MYLWAVITKYVGFFVILMVKTALIGKFQLSVLKVWLHIQFLSLSL
jgi:hypothetical protein